MDDHQINRALTSALRRAKGLAAADVDVRDCVDAERLAAWLSGALSTEEAAEVEQHLSMCGRCQEVAAVFAETAESAVSAAGRAPAAASTAQMFRTWMAPLAAAAAVVVWFAWPRPEPAGSPVPADTVARTLPSEPRAEVKAPAIGPAPSPAPAQPPTSGGTAAMPGQLARDQARERREAGTRSDSNRLADEQRLGQAMPPKAEPAFREPAAPAVATVTVPPPPPPSLPTPSPTAPPPAAPRPAATAMPVTAPPPSPPVMQAAAAATQLDAARSLAIVAETIDPRAVVAEFATVLPSPGAVGGAVAGSAGRGGAGGRGGGGGAGAVAARQAANDAKAATNVLPRWRVLASGSVERSTDGGATWTPVLIDPPAQITTGASPSPTICWLAGRGGVVLRSTAGQPFVRVTPPTGTNIASIRATSALDATVTTTDGRSFRTTDGGATWTPV